MFRTMFKSKIHRATVTHADLNYVGSVTVDAERARFWLGRGALPTRSVHNIFKRLKVSA